MKKEKFYLYISAIILSLSLTFNNFSFLAWFSVAPLIIYINKYDYSFKEGYKLGFAYFVFFYSGVFSWVLELFPLDWLGLNSFWSIIILIFSWLILASIEACIIAFIIPIYKFIKSNKLFINIISFSFLWIMFEWIQSIGILGMPWARLAVSQGYNTYLIQGASLFGILFVSFIILLVNGSIASFILSKKNFNYIYIAIIIFSLNLAFGASALRNNLNEGNVNITLVQGNISSLDKWSSGGLNSQVQKYLDLTTEGISSSGIIPELIIWPETAVITNLLENKFFYNKLLNLSKKYNSTLITGAFYDEYTTSEVLNYNSIYTISPSDNAIQHPYSKRHLVPFGEYIPFRNQIEKLIPSFEDFELMGELTPGDDVYLQNTNYGQIGGIICFESIFPNLVRTSVNSGSELIVLVTNDSWFKDSSALYQHHKQAIFRAIENNRYVARAANTGISSVINNKGEVIESIPMLEKGVINSKVNMISKRTLYSFVGDLLIIIGLVWILLIKFIFTYLEKNKD